MSDLTTRLRNGHKVKGIHNLDALMQQAADELDRLEAQLAEANDAVAQMMLRNGPLIIERDDANMRIERAMALPKVENREGDGAWLLAAGEGYNAALRDVSRALTPETEASACNCGHDKRLHRHDSCEAGSAISPDYCTCRQFTPETEASDE
jgi:hypothetical protein